MNFLVESHQYADSPYLHLLLVPSLQVVSNGNTGNQYPPPPIPGNGGVLVTCIYITDHLWEPAINVDIVNAGIILGGDIERFAHFSAKNLIEIGQMGEKSHSKI